MALSIKGVYNWDDVPDEQLEETYLERIEGLKEMFSEKLRNRVFLTYDWSWWLVKETALLTKSAIWVITTSSLVMLMPYFIEKELYDAEKIQTKTQQQLLLGPGKALEKNK